MQTSGRIASAIGFACAVSGCVSEGSLRMRAPYFVVQTARSPDVVAECILNRWSKEPNFAVRQVVTASSTTIVGSFGSLAGADMSVDVEVGRAAMFRRRAIFSGADVRLRCAVEDCARS